MSEPMALTTEQQFSLKSFEVQVRAMNQEQAQEMLNYLYRQMIERENMYKHFLKHQWGIETPKL